MLLENKTTSQTPIPHKDLFELHALFSKALAWMEARRHMIEQRHSGKFGPRVSWNTSNFSQVHKGLSFHSFPRCYFGPSDEYGPLCPVLFEPEPMKSFSRLVSTFTDDLFPQESNGCLSGCIYGRDSPERQLNIGWRLILLAWWRNSHIYPHRGQLMSWKPLMLRTCS
jgi:hypothetical protein